MLDQSNSLDSGLYFTDFINDGLVNVLGAAGKTTQVTFNANVRSSTSFVNALDTPANTSIPASGNKQGVINLEGGTGVVSVKLTGNTSDQIIRAHNAIVFFAQSEASNQPCVWGGEIDLAGGAIVSISPNFLKPDFPIGAVPGDPDYTGSIAQLGPVIRGFDSTDFLTVTKQRRRRL